MLRFNVTLRLPPFEDPVVCVTPMLVHNSYEFAMATAAPATAGPRRMRSISSGFFN